MVSLAYYILAHKEPERIVRLINTLKTPTDFFYLNFGSDISRKKYSLWKNFIAANCPNANLKIVSEYRCKWGSFETVYATLSAMKYFENFNYDYFINLSGDCYPIKPIHQIKQFFQGKNEGFMEFFKLPADVWQNGGLDRFRYKHYFLCILNRTHIVRLKRLHWQLPCNLKPYGGSSWFCLPKKQVSYILSFVAKNVQILKFFGRCALQDEVFFQTMLLNSPFKNEIQNDNKRFINWEEGTGAHPKILTLTDLPKLFSSNMLFARKFSLAIDSNILDIIDKEIECKCIKN